MILVFVGAGGSASVDPKQYPTTVEFFKRLPEDIRNDPVFISVHEFLQNKKADQSIDIEEVLWNLDELRDYFKASIDTKAVAGWIMRQNRVDSLVSRCPDLSNLLNGMVDLKENRIPSLKDRINAQVYNLYEKTPADDKLLKWVQLLKVLTELDLTIEIFTVNYDLVLENVIRVAKIDVKTGRRFDGTHARLDTTCWDHSETRIDTHGRLTKLHGSVDWQLSNGEILMSPVFTGNHKNHLILYPGYKGAPNREPFRKFHEHLRAVVRKAKAAIFIGFAFRDEYINSILSGLRPEIPKLVINKDDSLPNLPFLEVCEHFSNGFTAETVEDCIKRLARRPA